MELILEKLDSEIFTDEMKTELLESFDSMVDVKSSEKAMEMVEAKQADYETYIAEEIATHKAELTEKLDAYLDQVIESFVKDNELAMVEAVEKEKMEAVLEGFNSLLVTTGVDLMTISESKTEIDNESLSKAEEELTEAHQSNDELIEQVITLKAQNEELLKTGLIQEEMTGLTVVQKEKFVKLAETLEFDIKNPTRFMAQLDAIKSTVSDVTVTESVVVKDEVKEVIVESVKSEETIVEKAKDKKETGALYQTSARHLY